MKIIARKAEIISEEYEARKRCEACNRMKMLNVTNRCDECERNDKATMIIEKIKKL